MSTKHTSTVLANCADDEPIFVLRAQDESAAQVIKYWLQINQHHLSNQKVANTIVMISNFDEWPSKKQPD